MHQRNSLSFDPARACSTGQNTWTLTHLQLNLLERRGSELPAHVQVLQPSSCRFIVPTNLLDPSWSATEKIINQHVTSWTILFKWKTESDKMALACALIRKCCETFLFSLHVTKVDMTGKRIKVITENKITHLRILTLLSKRNFCLSLHRVWVSRLQSKWPALK